MVARLTRGAGPGWLLAALALLSGSMAVILTPPYFNLAENRRISATATCGEETQEPELYCKLVGANADRDVNVNVIQGQVCDFCDPGRPDKMHPPEFAVDGAETWWQSPPLSRGMKYNEVNLTIDLGQEFHVAYVFIKMANSPRPGIWVLERSLDNGETYQPWQYFADTISDCETYFETTRTVIERDDSVVCDTQFSKVVPLEGGEIVVSLLNNRPSANDFFNSTVLQEWTRATNIRLRFLRTKTLLGHLMSVARQDPTVTRRYFYSIKDISIGGRCVCNGHADTCDITDPEDPYKLRCRCQHNTCGANCDSCCPGFEQKAWRLSKSNKLFFCEPCNCFGHSNECVYDAKVDEKALSLDLSGNYDGGGVCQNCQHNTEGINCNKCKPGYFRPYGKFWNETDVCQPCDCEFFYSTGNCEEETGRCECRPEFTEPNCDTCSYGHFGYPDCRPCECHLNGTRGEHCESQGGQCPCKQNYGGKFCNKCAEGFYNFPVCAPCACNPEGSLAHECHVETGQCTCNSNFDNRTCSECKAGYYDYPICKYCNCDVSGTEEGICNKETGQCLCKLGYSGNRCDQCVAGYYGYPECKPCECSENGSQSTICDATGKCKCLYNFVGRTCDQCSPGYYKYPDCFHCNCDSHGAIGVSCDSEGKCQCRNNFDGNQCNQCKEGFYNFPICEDCNCDPAGVLATFEGCGTLPAGELCQCKEHVQGRICNECKPLYWNLHANNIEGCEDCHCFMPGVMGGMGVCDTKSGQCVCKPSVVARQCDQCAEGTYNLMEDNLFGCTDCNCDIGGAVDNACNKQTGQCYCKPKISGQMCSEPLKTYYFPTMYQYQYEVEDGHTPSRSPVRYGFDQSVFPGYSWKGYGVFSQLQNEIIQEVQIQRSSIYRMILRYMNLNDYSIIGTVTITPDNPSNIEQKFQVLFKPSKSPTFVTLSGPTGGIPSPLVMDPGRWAISFKNEKSLFLDYFVLLPAAYYEATILVEHVAQPCKVGSTKLCRHFSYPNLTYFDSVRGDGGYLTDGEERQPLNEYFTNQQQLHEVGRTRMPLINNKQQEIHLNLQLSKPGKHVLVINYITPANDSQTSTVHVETRSQHDQASGEATLYACIYTAVCPQAVTDEEGRVAVFNFDTNFISLVLKGEDNASIAIDSVTAIPLDQWSLDYHKPKSSCVKLDRKCTQSTFPSPPDSKKVEFEVGNEDRLAKMLPPLIDNSTKLIYLNDNDSTIDISGKVPHPGAYVFVVHYYQPNFPEFDTNVLVHNGAMYEAKLPVEHCPSISGCRAVVRQGDGNERFQLTENFVFSLNNPEEKGVWLDYILAIPIGHYTEEILDERPVDHTGAFLSECANDHFYVDTSTAGFCRDAIFSLTADYNNGALPCLCDFEGSLSFNCEPFGGQCQCKPNIIGRRCEACQTGYYGFPDCRPCDCPSTALCETNTGACICPPRVTGERCDQCEPLTYGFDPIIGCEECNCQWLGVERGNLQCDLLNGTCKCNENVVGRTCDRCVSGNWAYPKCQVCDCDLRGTTIEVCDQHSAECFCKKHVEGQACDLCKPGTFNIEEKNPDGCTKCFCSGKTDRCSSSSTLYRAVVSRMEDWTLAVVAVDQTVSVTPLHRLPVQLESAVGVDLTLEDTEDKVVYFVAPEDYIGNMLTSYGGAINYTIYYTTGPNGKAVSHPDVILQSDDLYILHFALEQPPATTYFSTSVDIVDDNFLLANGFSASHEQIMQVLQNLEGIFIRASYWSDSVTSRLQAATLDIALEGYNPNAKKALSVEHCHCPPNYKGLSCEECSPGYYRTSTGLYGGSCVACKCNGHSDTCDQATGICTDCKHNTMGDHCEQCAVGHHGNATNGTPVDCLICACPLPIPSNNFATACEVSPNGERISCECIEGYFGARCESCAAGYYGRPEIADDYCKPCHCSGNINPEDPGSCDSVTGDCLLCLNNTYGSACSLCSPGFYGDAIELKDCQTCVCDKCGTNHCNSSTGQCECNENVVGEKCDRCEVEHYGFNSCQGCLPCDCQEASESKQCDDNTGQCRCKPGVMGRACEKCANGFWNYEPEGCVSCGCNTEYAIGVGCNPNTGQCECLPGVIGEKCDHCPYRWVLIPEQGCFECNSCTHDLLDATDALQDMIDPIMGEFEDVAQGYFTTQRLKYINDTANNMTSEMRNLDPQRVNLSPITGEVDALEQDTKSQNRRADYAVENAEESAPVADKIRQAALEEEKLIKKAVDQARHTVTEVVMLAANLEGPSRQQIDLGLYEANGILDELKLKDFKPDQERAQTAFDEATDYFYRMKVFAEPVNNQSKSFDALRAKIHNFDEKLEDLHKHSKNADEMAKGIFLLNEQNKKAKENSKVEMVKNVSKESQMNIDNATDLLKEAIGLLVRAKEGFKDLNNAQDEEALDRLNETITQRQLELPEVEKSVKKAAQHAQELETRADELDDLLKESRNISNRGIEAANAYKNIANGTQEALKAAKAARSAAENATKISDGLGDRTGESEARSAQLLQDARGSLEKVQRELEPQLVEAKQRVADVEALNKHSDHNDTVINKALKRIPLEPLEPKTSKAIDEAAAADAITIDALQKSKEIIDKLPEDVKKARQLPKDVDDTNKAISQSNNQMEKVYNVVPNISNLINDLGKKQESLKAVGKDIEDQIKELKEKIAMARNLANRIRVGVTFHPNTVLQLKNPESLPLLGTSTRVSTYFKTEKPNGFLLYLGNAVGTQNKIRRATTDDFMALEIENGYPVLTIDLGSGPERIISDKYVADDTWYQIIIDRTGKNVKLIIGAEVEEGKEENFVKEQVLIGTKSILNLDQEHSKLFVGGYPNSFDIQKDVKYSSFEGQMEELMVGDVPVSLWNFEDADNNEYGSIDRDKLVNLQPSTGYRFDGHGYAILNGKSYQMKSRSTVQLKFKTFAKDGLLFLAGKDRSFLSIELKDGHVVFQYDLGHGLLTLTSKTSHNNGKWHTVDAVRKGTTGVLKVDGKTEFQDSAPGTASNLQVSDHIYFGGYPGQHNYRPVTNVDFEGCIDGVQISENLVDLSQNIQATGVIPGCPVRVASLVAFEESNPGYIRWPNTSAPNYLQINFKFKTTSRQGLLFYATDREQSSTVSLSLVDAGLVLRSQQVELVTSPSINYNDSEWHVVTVTHSMNSLGLDIDDYETFKSSEPPPSLHIAYGSLYFGGLPHNYEPAPGAVATQSPFIGCLGDATVNGVFINFANTTDQSNVILGKCTSAEHSEIVPPPPPPREPDGLPVTPRGEESEEEPIVINEDITMEPGLIDGDIIPGPVDEVTSLPIPTLAEPEPTPTEGCRLPLYPASDPDVTPASGHRFGTSRYSRIEYETLPAKYKYKHEFNLEFKTTSRTGVLFYVADERHTDFIALYMNDGQLVYSFNCGSGLAILQTPIQYDDGKWHTVLFSRHNKTGYLSVDSEQAIEGESPGSTRTINVVPPFYLGGLGANATVEAKLNMKRINSSFEGCLRNFKLNNKLVQNATKVVGVIPCSDKVEDGVFISADGGWLRVHNSFRVGTNINIKMEIKPRNVSGILLTVHSRDYLALEMSNGAIKFSVDNGIGAITAAFNPPNDHYFCDGQWHSIEAVKVKNVVILSVDKVHTHQSIGKSHSTSTDTRHPLFVGGHPNPQRPRGLETRSQYVGCIRNFVLNEERVKFTNMQAVGNVTTGICPTI